MREMKDSGVPWIGDIPVDWNVSIVLSEFEEVKNINKGMLEKNLLSLSYGNIVRKEINSNNGLLPDSFETYNIIPQNSIVLRLTDLQNDKRSLRSAICNEQGIITSAYTTIQLKSDIENHPRYMNYLFRCYDDCKVFYGLGNGVRQSINYSELKRVAILKPSYNCQMQIAKYLDTKCTQIDTIIAREQSVIEKLQEYKRAIITEVITKGLYPATNMKYSGLEWLRDIHVPWNVRSLKRVLITPITDGPHETPTLYDEGVPFVSAESVKGGIINLDYKRGYISMEDHERFQRKVSPKKGDIFIVKSGATTGNIGLVITDQIFDIWSPLALVRSDSSTVEQEFLYYQLLSNIFRVQVEQGWSYGTQQNIGMKALGNIKVIVPPLEEQRTIVKYLHKKCANIDSTILKKQSIIEKLNEYKQSLVYEVVTGKKEVSHV